MKKYKVILADPPWDMGKFGLGKDMRTPRGYKVGKAIPCPYPTMSIEEIKKLPIKEIAGDTCHLWIWTTNRTLHDTFHIIEEWGFKYLNIITFNKPTGIGAWFVNTTQHLIFAYKGKLEMGNGRYLNTSQYYTPKKHSAKPTKVYSMIEKISPYEERIELFARDRRQGWDVFGNQVPNFTQTLLHKVCPTENIIAIKRENSGFSPNPKSEILDFS